MPKIHPALDHLLTAFKVALDPISPDYWKEYAQSSFKNWAAAGKPVVAEDFPFVTVSGRVLNLTGNINMDVYPELRQAIMEAGKREEELAAARATIKKAMEGNVCWCPCKPCANCKEVLEREMEDRAKRAAASIRNEALEEAARSLEIKKCPRAAAWVRKLKTS